MYQNGIKIVLDKLVALMAILLLSPIFILITLMLLFLQKQAFFIQTRVGKNQKRFPIYKFQTMSLALDTNGKLLPDDARITAFGKWLRATSLDELPQLLNVLKGEMSIVGPRPHAVGMTAGSIEVTRTVGDYAHRHRMKPGMTGWAQINGSRGPCDTPDEVRERVRLDMEYVRRASVWLDAYIVLMTIPRLLGDRSRRR